MMHADISQIINLSMVTVGRQSVKNAAYWNSRTFVKIASRMIQHPTKYRNQVLFLGRSPLLMNLAYKRELQRKGLLTNYLYNGENFMPDLLPFRQKQRL